jgi:hypothetical protein
VFIMNLTRQRAEIIGPAGIIPECTADRSVSVAGGEKTEWAFAGRPEYSKPCVTMIEIVGTRSPKKLLKLAALWRIRVYCHTTNIFRAAFSSGIVNHRVAPIATR